LTIKARICESGAEKAKHKKEEAKGFIDPENHRIKKT
jgi:hypothetical protein